MSTGGLLRTLGFGLLAATLALLAAILVAGQDLRHVSLAQPAWLLATALPIGALLLRALRAPTPPTLLHSRARSMRHVAPGWAARLADLPEGARLGAGLVLAVALARPQSTTATDRVHHEGIDIAIALDLSESMEEVDMPPNRLAVAQAVIDAFIARRPHDRIALVGFGTHASTISPLTMDHDVLRALVKRLRLGVVDGSRTAIGAGLGVALNRLEESQVASKVIVLLTDGVHNAEGLDPDNAAQAAAERGVRIYTVLMGRHAGMGQSIDPSRLERLASASGGYAYTAQDEASLIGSFQDLLDRLERSEIEGEHVRAELFAWLLWPALLLLLLDAGLASTRLRRFP